MNAAARKVIVGVAVLMGTILCQLGDSTILLNAGENHESVGEVDIDKTRGVVVVTTCFSVKIRSEEDGLVTFYFPEKDKLTKPKVGTLAKGDLVTIHWSREGRKNGFVISHVGEPKLLTRPVALSYRQPIFR